MSCPPFQNEMQFCRTFNQRLRAEFERRAFYFLLKVKLLAFCILGWRKYNVELNVFHMDLINKSENDGNL